FAVTEAHFRAPAFVAEVLRWYEAALRCCSARRSFRWEGSRSVARTSSEMARSGCRRQIPSWDMRKAAKRSDALPSHSTIVPRGEPLAACLEPTTMQPALQRLQCASL